MERRRFIAGALIGLLPNLSRAFTPVVGHIVDPFTCIVVAEAPVSVCYVASTGWRDVQAVDPALYPHPPV